MYHVRTDRTGLKPEDIAAEGETGEAEVVRHLPSVDFRCPTYLLYENVVFSEDNSEDNPDE